MGNSARYRGFVRQALYNMIWSWCIKKHKRWGRIKLAEMYFKTKTEDNKYTKFKNRLWVFHGKTTQISHYKNRTKVIHLQDPTNTSTILASKNYIIPAKINHIHAWSMEVNKLIGFQTQLNLKAGGLHSTLKDKLMKRQKGICIICNNAI